MPSPQHEACRAAVVGWVHSRAEEPDVVPLLERYADALVVLYELDLEPAREVLAACYAPSPRGGKPTDPIIVLRCLLLALLVGQPSINKWVADLRSCRLLRVLCGLPETDRGPGVGTLYDMLHRLHDGSLRSCACGHQVAPSEQERRRARAAQPRRKKGSSEPKQGEDAVTARLVSELQAARHLPNLLLVAVECLPGAQGDAVTRLVVLFGVGCSAPSPTTADSTPTGLPLDTADSGTDDCAAPPVTVSCGTGELAFVPLSDGSPVTVVHGPQGGWHVWTGVNSVHSLQNVALLPTLSLPWLADTVISSNPAPGDFVALAYDVESCEGTYYGQRAFVDPLVLNPDPEDSLAVICSLAGKTLRLTIDLSELASSRTGRCEVDVVAELDPADVSACAAR